MTRGPGAWNAVHSCWGCSRPHPGHERQRGAWPAAGVQKTFVTSKEVPPRKSKSHESSLMVRSPTRQFGLPRAGPTVDSHSHRGEGLPRRT